ncbi:hypothetical protein AMAG_01282 [Allomyces macrogynus ATCC 38327]|uniref:Uncharacterized protein n=1 Tax=Allomyces macrogynus (strain ATCC 38327) TaxID=578462 RepID=A0A0L0RZ20_ALLM3|nr:hypothetical protein AMAG_01282 [Allomyces macrogynus ATCC 38327]|eukprot:KNE55385.1 hypothetical protein AMAG_01282 [Allomyces macrogynus ATCC 38327]
MTVGHPNYIGPGAGPSSYWTCAEPVDYLYSTPIQGPPPPERQRYFATRVVSGELTNVGDYMEYLANRRPSLSDDSETDQDDAMDGEWTAIPSPSPSLDVDLIEEYVLETVSTARIVPSVLPPIISAWAAPSDSDVALAAEEADTLAFRQRAPLSPNPDVDTFSEHEELLAPGDRLQPHHDLTSGPIDVDPLRSELLNADTAAAMLDRLNQVLDQLRSQRAALLDAATSLPASSPPRTPQYGPARDPLRTPSWSPQVDAIAPAAEPPTFALDGDEYEPEDDGVQVGPRWYHPTRRPPPLLMGGMRPRTAAMSGPALSVTLDADRLEVPLPPRQRRALLGLSPMHTVEMGQWREPHTLAEIVREDPAAAQTEWEEIVEAARVAGVPVREPFGTVHVDESMDGPQR